MSDDDLGNGDDEPQRQRILSPTTSVSFDERDNTDTTANNCNTALHLRDDASCVQVAVRVRPLLALEGDDENCMQILQQTAPSAATGDTTTASIQVGGSAGPRFTFDQVFGIRTPQQQIYQARVAPLVHSCLQGYNATILAYGQSGSGVSFCALLLCVCVCVRGSQFPGPCLLANRKRSRPLILCLSWLPENSYNHGTESNDGS